VGERPLDASAGLEREQATRAAECVTVDDDDGARGKRRGPRLSFLPMSAVA
jgi:hypothetical protein